MPHAVQRTPIDLSAVVADAVAAARRRTVTPTTSEPQHPTTVRGDGDQLRRLFRNLIDNATTHATARVDVSIEAHGELVAIVVADDGAGIPRRTGSASSNPSSASTTPAAEMRAERGSASRSRPRSSAATTGPSRWSTP